MNEPAADRNRGRSSDRADAGVLLKPPARSRPPRKTTAIAATAERNKGNGNGSGGCDRRERRSLLFGFFDRNLQRPQEFLVQRRHADGRGVALLDAEVEGGDLRGLAAPRLVEADGGLEDERDLVALGLDAVQA